jgi:hypothetical protein
VPRWGRSLFPRISASWLTSRKGVTRTRDRNLPWPQHPHLDKNRGPEDAVDDASAAPSAVARSNPGGLFLDQALGLSSSSIREVPGQMTVELLPPDAITAVFSNVIFVRRSAHETPRRSFLEI